MADFVLGRLKFTFLGPWAAATSYIKDDIITYGGIAYACTGNHTASSFFYTDISNWTKIAPGFNWTGPWTANTQYNLNDVVRYGADAYIVTSQHRSGNVNSFAANTGNFQLFAGGLQFLDNYANTVNYSVGDVITYGGYSYVAALNNINQYPNINTAAWDIMTTGYIAVGNYSSSRKYEPGEVVNYGAFTFVNKLESTGVLPSTTTNWDLVSKGTQYLGTYDSANNYVQGDVVRFGGNTYYAKTETVSVAPTVANSTQWITYNTGSNFRDMYVNGQQYNAGDVVRFGGNTYIALVSSANITPTTSNTTQWTTYNTGSNFRDMYVNGQQYNAGDVVRFGGNTYIALLSSTNITPTTANITQWTTYNTGTNYTNYYNPGQQYNAGDISRFGGNTYIALTSSTNITPTTSNTTQWAVYSEGIRGRGTWSSATTYQLGETVFYANSSYVNQAINNTNIVPANNGASWFVLAQGSLEGTLTTPGDLLIQTSGGMARLPVGANGQILVVSNTGLPQWEDASPDANVYYICADSGIDNPYSGITAQRPWQTIQYATQRLDAANSPGQNLATIMLRGGVYKEKLPITLPPGCSIFGDTTRTTIIEPAAGLSLDNVVPNANSTMFFLSESTGMGRMTLRGMTGYIPSQSISANTAYQAGSDINTHTIGGVFLRLNPNSPIINKSPYINDMTAISTGGIAAMIDGNVHTTGNKSMLFHSFTILGDNGVGYYVTNGGRAEIVSCFTYFCYFGYVANNGGIIRALNGNNSYGVFGAVATGYLLSENPITANVYGSMVQYIANTVYPSGSIFTSNNYMLGATSNARALVLTFQTSTQQVYFNYTGENANTFANNEILIEYSDSAFTTTTGFYANSQTAGAVTGQNGSIVTINNISANTNILPGCSLQFSTGAANTGYDPYSYVVASVSNWGSNSNTAIVTLASAKPASNPAFDGQHVLIRQNFSNIRLTGHDFLSIGTGGIANTNYPNTSVTQNIPSNQTIQNYPGRVYYVSTDQGGNFAVGPYFSVNQATGSATLNASAFNLSGLSSLRLGSIGAQIGAQINEFSTDSTFSQNSNVKVPTQAAVKSYVDSAVSSVTANLTSFASSTNTSISQVRVSDAIYDATYNSANTVFYANNNISFFKNSIIEYSNTVFNSNGFITNFNEKVNTAIGGGGTNYRYTIACLYE